MRSCNRTEGGIYTKERESLSLVQRRKRESKGIHLGADKKGVYITVKVTINSTSIFYRKAG